MKAATRLETLSRASGCGSGLWFRLVALRENAQIIALHNPELKPTSS